MHECPFCGQACDCDGEDIWNEDAQTIINCTHYIEFGCDDPEEDDDYAYDGWNEDTKLGTEEWEEK